jgi:hypothetical protein
MKKRRKFQEDRRDKRHGSASSLVEPLSFSEFRRRRGDGVFPILNFSVGRAYQSGTYNIASGSKVLQFRAHANSTLMRRLEVPRWQLPASSGIARELRVIRKA